MQKLWCVVVMALAGFAAPAMAAELKVAVVNYEEVLWTSDAGKKWADSVNASMKPQTDKMAELKKAIDADNLKAQKDGAIMSDKEKRDLDQKRGAEISQYQQIEQDAQRALNESRQNYVDHVGAKIKAIVEDMRKAGGYTLILSASQVVVYVDPAFDLTKKIIDKLNATPDAAGGSAPAAQTP